VARRIMASAATRPSQPYQEGTIFETFARPG
jgi:hypothetical protein